VDCPFAAVAAGEAGDRIVCDGVAALDQRCPAKGLILLKTNVDYSGTRATWGFHENYGHKTPSDNLAAQLIPHLVSRIVYAGSGGFNPLHPGIEFCLSPRACHLRQVATVTTTAGRGLWHEKQEPLARPPWQRLHLICADPLRSHQGAALRFGTTALIIAMAEAGLQPGAEVRLQDPLQALHAFNANPAARVPVNTPDGLALDAVGIQRRYLETAKRHLDRAWMPPWARRVCELWSQTLDGLRRGPPAVAKRLDWAIKLSIYSDWVLRSSVGGACLKRFNSLCTELADAAAPDQENPLRAALFGPAAGDPATESTPSIARGLAKHGLSARQFRQCLRLRDRLRELDIRFGQLGPSSLFAELDRHGLLEHRLPEVADLDIRNAMDHAPGRGRARVRGEVVQRHTSRLDLRAEWDGIHALDGRRLDLSEPFLDREPPWVAAEQPPPPIAEWVPDSVLNEVENLYGEGRYEIACAALESLGRRHATSAGPAEALWRPRYDQLLAWVQSRRGDIDAVMALLPAAARNHRGPFVGIHEHVAARRFAGLVPRSDIWEWIGKADDYTAAHPELERDAAFACLGHKAFACLVQERLADAKSILERLTADGDYLVKQARLAARAWCHLAEVHRLQRCCREAWRCLDTAARIQEQHNFLGDRAEFTLGCKAKLVEDGAAALRYLDDAEAIQNRLAHRMGWARTLFLRARLSGQPAVQHECRVRLESLCAELPSLRVCPKATELMELWPDWTAGKPSPTHRDFFWGV
jgi:hypothetical protein